MFPVSADRWLHDWRPLEPGSDPNIDVWPGRLLIRVGERPEVYNRQTGEYRVSMEWIGCFKVVLRIGYLFLLIGTV